jgi:HD-like signal output (HDOD) protein
MANSALFSGGVPTTKLHQAVVRLGMFQCKNLILSIGMKSLIWQMAGDEKVQCETLWHHGYVTGHLCHQINRIFRIRFDEAGFSAGLLHDLGRILLLLADLECFERANAIDFREEPGLLQRERTAISIDHCALGGWFGEHSNLPDILIQAMRLHHDPEPSKNNLVALVATADHMANYLQRGEEVETYNPEENLGLASLWARWPAARKERLVSEIPSLMEGALRAAAGK